MISVNNLTIEFSSQVLFDNINYVINPKDKIALVGKERSRQINDAQDHSRVTGSNLGRVAIPADVTIGYLPQQMVLEDKLTVAEEVRKVFAHISDMQRHLDHMNQELAERTDYESDDYQSLIERVSNLTEELALASSENCEAELEDPSWPWFRAERFRASDIGVQRRLAHANRACEIAFATPGCAAP